MRAKMGRSIRELQKLELKPNWIVGSVSFTYDELNRLSSAQTPGTDCTAINGLTKNWGNSYVYDRFGNLLQKNQIKCTTENLVVTVDPATNRLTPASTYSYDAAGNLLMDGLGHTYTYNAENKVTASGSTTFTYDGDGVRVKKSGWRMYWTGMGTEVLAESDLTGAIIREYFYFGGRRIGFRKVSTDTVWYYLPDHLDSTAVMVNASGSSIQEESDFFPFGGEREIVDLIDNRMKFIGKEQDTSSEGGLTHFLFREYTTNLGRFMSPDLLAGNIGDPQSLNRYAYVLNNPANLVDPLGLLPDEDRTPHYLILDARLLSYGWNGPGVCVLTFSCVVFTDEFGMQIDSRTAMQQLHNGSAVVCPQCRPGQVVDAANQVWGWNYDTRGTAGGTHPDAISRILAYWGVISTVSDFDQWSLQCRMFCGADGNAVFNKIYPPMDEVTARSPLPPPDFSPASTGSYGGCVAGALMLNFFGSEERAGITIAVNIAGFAAKRAAPLLVPGAGWAYTGAALLWDGVQIGSAFLQCR